MPLPETAEPKWTASPARTVRAVRYYLEDSDSGRVEWPCPDFLRNKPAGGGAVELSVDEDLWDSFEQEASRQGVPVQRLAEHAALYFAADRDAGRVTQRILSTPWGTEPGVRAAQYVKWKFVQIST
jgi:hypothetical protein